MLISGNILQNRYRIIRQLGAGGMGTVYEAVDERLDNTVALKECHFTDERLRKQFEREARLLARLRHSAMTRVIDHFSEGDGQFLVMDFIIGEDLSGMLQRRGRQFPPDEVLKWADQLLDALDYLHSQDPPVVHRDIKPQNLKLTAKGQIMLLDFGLAKGFAGQISRVTTSGSIFGYTPNYAPLEQIQGTGTDPRSDLYSLAATIYHMVTGVVPPDVLTRLTATTDGLPDPLRPANEVNPQVSAEVAAVLSRGMTIGRNQRLATAAEMQKSLRDANQSQTQTSNENAETITFIPSTVATPAQKQGSQEQEFTPLMQTITDPIPIQRSPESGPAAMMNSLVTVEQRKPKRESSSLVSLDTYNSAGGRNSSPWRFAIPALVVLIISFGIFYALQRNTSIAKRDEPVPANSNQNASASSPIQNSSNQNSVQANPSLSPAENAPTPSPTKNSPIPSPTAASNSETPSSQPTPTPKPSPTPQPPPRAPIPGGVLNGKAISLPKPPYPAIARSARASGMVVVQVTIDESGKVISARAISGHPLLQAAAVQAAYGARFSPTQLSGQPVKVTGTISYNFVQ